MHPLTLDSVGFSRIRDSVGKDEAVLSVDEILDGLKGALLEEFPLLHGRIQDFRKGVLMRSFGGSAQKVFVVLRAFWGGKENVVTSGDFDTSLILACFER